MNLSTQPGEMLFQMFIWENEKVADDEVADDEPTVPFKTYLNSNRNYQLSVYSQQSTSQQSSTVNSLQSTVSHLQSTVYSQQSVIHSQQWKSLLCSDASLLEYSS